MTRVSELTFDVHQVRDGGFYPSALEKGTSTARAINLVLVEIYPQRLHSQGMRYFDQDDRPGNLADTGSGWTCRGVVASIEREPVTVYAQRSWPAFCYPVRFQSDCLIFAKKMRKGIHKTGEPRLATVSGIGQPIMQA
ncbi:MAG: hypothetical protein E5299_02085 [Burkholderia gladioli]|nr:MAG: hypothetical protein E5299_02085 [Burkholderia gladioli]